MEVDNFQGLTHYLEQLNKKKQGWDDGIISLTKPQLQELERAIRDTERKRIKACTHKRVHPVTWDNSDNDGYGGTLYWYYLGIECEDCKQIVLKSSISDRIIGKVSLPSELKPIIEYAEWWERYRGRRNAQDPYDLSSVGIKTEVITEKRYVDVPVKRYASR